MKIKELEKRYFGNVCSPKSTIAKLLDESGLDFDEWSEPDEFGFREKMLRTEDDKLIPVEDFIAYDKDKFVKMYPGKAALQSFTNFRRKYKVFSNKEALEYYKNKIIEEKKKIDSYVLDADDMSCGTY